MRDRTVEQIIAADEIGPEDGPLDYRLPEGIDPDEPSPNGAGPGCPSHRGDPRPGCRYCRREAAGRAEVSAPEPEPEGEDLPPAPEAGAVRIVTAQEFAAIEEAGPDPLVGEPGEAMIVEGGDGMLYGDGGTTKTTLGIDLGCHLAAGDPWIGIPVPTAVKVGMIEAEGPRPPFRDKVGRKLDGWRGSDLGDRLLVLEEPWAEFRFDRGAEVAESIGSREIDVLIVGPLTAVGMDELGTLQQVREFMAVVERFRARSGRRLAVFLIHHENKGGKVSGAWEGAGDTLLHASLHGRGRTTLYFQKTRWSSRWHKQTLDLDWTEGEGFEVVEEEERDLLAEVSEWLRANPHSTKKEIAPGIEASETAVADVLEANLDVFRRRTGEEAREVERHPSGHVWEVRTDGP